MDRKYIDDNHIVARYLADQLTDEERGEFEACLLEQPELVRDVEAAARFKAGLATMQDKGLLEAAIRSRPPVHRRWLTLAAAFAVAILAGGLFWLMRPVQLGPVLATTAGQLAGNERAPLAIVARYVVLRTRSTYDARIAMPSTPSAVELRVFPEALAPGAPHRIVLSIEEGEEPGTLRAVADIDDAIADDEGYVAVFLRADLLAPGRYVLQISAQDARVAPSTFSIRMIPQRSP